MTAARKPADLSDTFEPYGLGWRAVVCQRTVRFTVRRLRHDGGTLRGYVDVEFKAPGAPRLRLAGEVVNLSSGRDRASFANRLAERQPGPDWRNIVDAFCVEVERRDDEGEEVVLIGNLPAPINGGWLVEGLLERGQNNGIHGDGSVGKSWLALACAVSVTAGVEILPGYRPTQRGAALYLDYETDKDTLNMRVQQIARGAGIAPPDILYLRMDSPLSDNVERILAICQQYGVVLIVVDSVEAAMAGSVAPGASSNEGPSKVNRGLRRLGGITSLLIDHVSAEQGRQTEVARKAFGSIFKRNWVRLAFHLQQSREPSDDGMRHLGLFCAKRNNGKEFDPVGLAWEINDEVCQWRREDISSDDLQDSLPPIDRVVAYLRREGPSQPSAIVEGTGLKRTTVTSMLTRKQGKLFVRTVTGLWDAAPTPAPEPEYAGADDQLPWPDAGDADA